VRAVGGSGTEGPPSDTVQAFPQLFASDSVFLDYVQRTAIDFFWYESNPANGLIRDRSQPGSPASIAAVGFGLTSICVGVDRGWIARAAAAERVQTTLQTFWRGPQGTGTSGTNGYKGFFYHFLDMSTATRMVSWAPELSSIDTGLLLAGILYSAQFFDGTDLVEIHIRQLADSIYARMDWQWMQNGGVTLTHGWNPESGFLPYRWTGYCEAMILYLLAIGAPANAIPGSSWNAWTSGYSWQTQYTYAFVNFPPLFGHQYSHCWVDFRNIADAYMASKGITYAENTRRETLAQRLYCIANPGGFTGYGADIWGLTACDGPSGTGYFGYSARGAPPAQNDDGTVAPTAPAGSMPFTPEVSLPALRAMYDRYRATIWTGYGFCDAFNLKANWWDTDVVGIDEGPIAIMFENYRSGSVWNRFMQDQNVQLGLQGAGFAPVTGVEENGSGAVTAYSLDQNYPNPFNGSTRFRFALPAAGPARLEVFDVLGRSVATLVDGPVEAGTHTASFEAGTFASGVYFARLTAGGISFTRSLVLMK
jgi:hypothetical protein